ncbi:hypothetical protein G7046_g9495 [Stylonectria norvegica]|nr:hypothetical protein G7046_g9495 [Stylonectria norvegica]
MQMSRNGYMPAHAFSEVCGFCQLEDGSHGSFQSSMPSANRWLHRLHYRYSVAVTVAVAERIGSGFSALRFSVSRDSGDDCFPQRRPPQNPRDLLPPRIWSIEWTMATRVLLQRRSLAPLAALALGGMALTPATVYAEGPSDFKVRCSHELYPASPC